MNDQNRATPVESSQLSRHYREVESFQAARARSVQRLSKVMMAAVAILLLGNVAETWTIAVMMPLTRIEPVYLWVRPDGTVDSSIALSRLPPTQSRAVVNAALWEYVRLREGYSFDTARYGYDVVSEFSAPNVRQQYQRFFNYPNPESPQTVIARRGIITISHISSSDLGAGVQQIRYIRTVTLDGRSPSSTTWTATIGFATISNLPVKMRLTNPGGLMVTAYQSSEDSP